MKRIADPRARVKNVSVLERYETMSATMLRCNGLGVDLSHKRCRKNLWPRVVIAYALYKEGFTEQEIGSVMNRDHSTINHYKDIMENGQRLPRMYWELIDLNSKFKAASQWNLVLS